MMSIEIVRAGMPRQSSRAAISCLLAIVLCGCATTVAPSSSSRQGPLLDVAGSKFDSPSAQTMFAMAKLFKIQDRVDQAEVLLANVIEEYPLFAPAYCELAEIRLERGKVDSAMEVLVGGIEAAPNDSILLNDLGVCYILNGEPAQALEYFQRAVALNPIQKRYRANEALAQGLLGEEAEALRLYETIMSGAEARHNLTVIAEMNTREPNQKSVDSAPAALIGAAKLE